VKLLLVFLVFYSGILLAQPVRIVGPSQPVVQGNAFQLQYIITDPQNFLQLDLPSGDSIRIVSGPNVYEGKEVVGGVTRSIRNLAYTLVALSPGKLRVNPLSAHFKTGSIRLPPYVLQVVAPQKASFNSKSNYTDARLYAPPTRTDPGALLADNLFVKAELSKTITRWGEPVVATFKLYSRLQSTSEVVNAPSLYGFTVMDILNINESLNSVETISGKVFNTSVLRKLQLYPEQTGELTIDPMTLDNEVEFIDSATGKSRLIKNSISTEPLRLKVQALPGNRPADFGGAVGSFSIRVQPVKMNISAGATSRIYIKIEGAGNFTQMDVPQVDWPAGIDAFETETADSFNKNLIPITGSRTISYPFSVSHAGSYVIPPIVFQFFDLKTNTYKKIRTDSIYIQVNPSLSKVPKAVDISKIKESKPAFIAIAVSMILLLLLLIGWRRRKRPVVEEVKRDKTRYSVEATAINTAMAPDAIRKIRELLKKSAAEYGPLNERGEARLQQIFRDASLWQYSPLLSTTEAEELKAIAVDFLTELEKDHSAYL